MAKGKKPAKKAMPVAPFSIGQIVQLVTGGRQMVVTDVHETCGHHFMVHVAFFGRSEGTVRGSLYEPALIERHFDARVLTHDADIPF